MTERYPPDLQPRELLALQVLELVRHGVLPLPLRAEFEALRLHVLLRLADAQPPLQLGSLASGSSAEEPGCKGSKCEG